MENIRRGQWGSKVLITWATVYWVVCATAGLLKIFALNCYYLLTIQLLLRHITTQIACNLIDRRAEICRDLFATLRGSPIHATHPQLRQLQLIGIEATVVIDSGPLCCYQYAICRLLQLPARHALAQHNSVPPTAHRPTHTENNNRDFCYQLQFSAKFEWHAMKMSYFRNYGYY